MAESSIRKAQRAMKPFPQLAAMGFLHDAEKEFAEARLTQALIGGDALVTYEELEVAHSGLAERIGRGGVGAASSPSRLPAFG